MTRNKFLFKIVYLIVPSVKFNNIAEILLKVRLNTDNSYP